MLVEKWDNRFNKVINYPNGFIKSFNLCIVICILNSVPNYPIGILRNQTVCSFYVSHHMSDLIPKMIDLIKDPLVGRLMCP